MARDLPESSKNGQHCDPFCSLRCGDEKMKTAVAARTADPKWKQQFTFGSSQGLTGDEDLVILVKHWDRFSSNDFLGAVTFPISIIIKNQKKKESEIEGELDLDSTGQWYKLKAFPGYKTRSGEVKGEIYLKMLVSKWSMGASRPIPSRSTPTLITNDSQLDTSNSSSGEQVPQLPIIGEESSLTFEIDEGGGALSPLSPPLSMAKRHSTMIEEGSSHIKGIRDVLVEKLALKGSNQKPGRLFSPFFETTKVNKDIGRLHLQLTYVAISH